MKAFQVGDKVQVKTTARKDQGVPVGVIVTLEVSANGERAARVAYETYLGTVAKLIFVRQLRRAK